MIRRLPLLAVVLLGAGAACAPASPETPPERSAEAWVEATLDRLTLREKVGQMVFPRVPVDYLPAESDAFDRVRPWIEDLGVGGVVIHGGGLPLEVAARMNLLQRAADVPLLVTADMEPGPLQNPSATRLPLPMALAATGEPRLAYDVGRITALEARAQGVHVTFAPVVDVNNNPANPIINTRSYGEDPERVAAFAVQHARGLQDHGLLAVAKHFPGHGNTATDSHIELPFVAVDRAAADTVELVPYRAVIDAGIAGVMTAHIAFPAITGDSLPATLSPALATGLLREELGFEGIIFTDAMDMGAIIRRWGAGPAAVMAVKAGADALLQPLPDDVPVMVDAVVAAVERGEVPAERIDRSVRRLLAAKARLGLHRQRLVDLDRIPEVLGIRPHVEAGRDMARRSITLARDRDRLLPLDTARARRVLSITYTDEPSYTRAQTLQQALDARFDQVDAVALDSHVRPAALDSLLARADAYDVALFSPFVRPRWAKGSVAIAPEVAAFVERLAARRPLVVATFGSPYVLTQFPSVGTYLLAWSGEDIAQRAAAEAIAGEIPITGRLPVSIPPFHERGEGVTVGAARAAEAGR